MSVSRVWPNLVLLAHYISFSSPAQNNAPFIGEEENYTDQQHVPIPFTTSTDMVRSGIEPRRSCNLVSERKFPDPILSNNLTIRKDLIDRRRRLLLVVLGELFLPPITYVPIKGFTTMRVYCPRAAVSRTMATRTD